MSNSSDNMDLSGYESIDIYLPGRWVMYLYNKSAFKKLSSKSNHVAKPYTRVCEIATLNDLIYIIQLMKVPATGGKINLDMNDYVIMRKGIEPIWEDPKNANGGTFSVKAPRKNGYAIWSDFMIRTLGETLVLEMEYINGISVTFMSDYKFSNGNVNGDSYNLIKVWDGRDKDNVKSFLDILPATLTNTFKEESCKYLSHRQKKHYGNDNVVRKLGDSRRGKNKRGRRGGFRR